MTCCCSDEAWVVWQGGRITLGIHRGDEKNVDKLLLTAVHLSAASLFCLSLLSHLSPLSRKLWSTVGLAICFDVNKIKLDFLQAASFDYFDFSLFKEIDRGVTAHPEL